MKEPLNPPAVDNLHEVAALGASVDAGAHTVSPSHDTTLINLPAKAAAVLTVTLPPVGLCEGRMLSLRVIADGGDGAVATVVSGADSAVALSIDLDASGEQLIVHSDGYAWSALIAPAQT